MMSIKRILSEVWIVYLDEAEYNRYISLEEAENKVAELIKQGYKAKVIKDFVRQIEKTSFIKY